ncbi:MAG: polysaccharide biosynthesis protein [Clostridiales bacterium]|jgi:stage V sporulation protein B|nr:polysaccharide biosynthesis protein [Clostridiales bacterium]
MRGFFKGAGILAVCALSAKMIGALYRIPLTNIVGAEGMGLYQMVFPLYTVLLTISSGGLPVAISKVVASKIARRDEGGARRVLFVSLVSLTAAGLAASLAVIIFRGQIASVQGNPAAGIPYLGIAPSLVLVAVISCFRGYYQGLQNMLPSALSQLIEQAVKLAAGLFFARIFLRFSLEWAVFGALLGVSASELVAMLALLCQFYFTDRRFRRRSRIDAVSPVFEAAAEADFRAYRPVGARSTLREIYGVAIPVTLGSLVMPVTGVIDSILVINLLAAGGFSRGAATSLFGLVTGPVNSLINMPVVVTLSLAAALLPKVSEAEHAKTNPAPDIARCLKASLIVGVFSALFLGLYADSILSALYSKGLSAAELRTGAALLSTGSVSVFYVGVLQIATSALQAAGQPHRPALNLLCGAVLKVVLTLLLLPYIGVAGAMAATVLCYGLTCFLDVLSMKKFYSPRLKFKEFIAAPLAASAGFCAAALLTKGTFAGVLGPAPAFIASSFCAAAAFALLLALAGGVKRAELAAVPVVGRLFRGKKKIDRNKVSK